MSRIALFAVFFATLIGLFGLMQWRLYRLFRSWVNKSFEAKQGRHWMLGGRAFLFLLNILFLVRFLFSEFGHYDSWLVQALVIYPGGILAATIVLGFFLISLRDLLFLGTMALRKAGSILRPRRQLAQPERGQLSHGGVDQGRRRFLRVAGLTAAGSVGALPMLSSAATAHDYQINRIPLAFDSLPRGLEGFTIAHVSDIHSGIYMTEKDMREIFELVKSLDATMIVLTGDQVDNADSQIPPLHKALTDLKAEYGVYACLGNHDHYATASKVTAAMTARGIQVLNNAHRTLTVDGEHLSIIGIDDAGSGVRNFARLDRALEGSDADSFRVLLTHRPDVFAASRKQGIDLTLAGHTHGGQVGIEFAGIKLNPAYLVHQYAKGLYTEEGRHLYVNVGVGMVGVPIRLVKPEIALISLHGKVPVKAIPYAESPRLRLSS